ncbi:hypothetical protein J3D47_005352 [Pseudomonas laurylsulfativorans]|uniref:hypothetical protein n=1 Tax=Pseudomonas laurylsulfativorans TaxID=1943631 RepID=UPI00209E9F26|nr:hypothetical protein [Pseudomonas laurylsulfativorans]MCP1421109.1 hypothetical protein [Pseudomonas laurylsulfativorans]
MRNKFFPAPVGYVSGAFEIVFCVIVLLFYLVFSLHIYSKLIDVPPVPGKLIMKDAFLYRGLSQASKTTSFLYLRVGADDATYKYIIEASSRDVVYANFDRPRKLWVAVESDRSKKFVWGVYDDDFGLLISRQDILRWANSVNIDNYFILSLVFISSLYFLYIIFWTGVWNRCAAKRVACENKQD